MADPSAQATTTLDALPIGIDGLVVLVVYLLGIVGIGFWGRAKRKEESLSDHYLAGRELGFFVLLLTLFATQYSGNTLFGFTAKGYRMGYAWVMSVHAMTAVVVGYLLFAPALHRHSRDRNYITPADYLDDRFNSRAIRLVCALIMIFATANYVYAQLKVMGLAVGGLTGGRIDPIYGVVGLAVVMILYETLGGMRSVAWTDAIQGFLLLLGFTLLVILVMRQHGTLADAAVHIREHNPEKIAVPNATRCAYWFSMVLLIGLGASVYPHAIQRIYAAKNPRILRKSLKVMAFFPFVTTLIVLLVGLIALRAHPGLDHQSSERLLAIICGDLAGSGSLGYWTVIVILAAIMAALMSTADSALLSLSSMATKDLYGTFLNPTANEQKLTRVGKSVSWVVLALLVWLSSYEDLTLVQLLEVKFEVLLQVVPAFYLGVHLPRLKGGPVLLGMLVGLGLAITLLVMGIKTIDGVHAGVVALAANTLTVLVGHALGSRQTVAAPG